MLGPYRLLNRIGEGGMGIVYLAEAQDGTPVAVKAIRREYAERPEFRRRFENEAAAASQVRAFCTARVLGACLTGPDLYLATEYIVGHDLHELVRVRGPLTGSGLEQLAIGVATALAAIHDVGLVHRDLTPANVLSSETGLRVIDFGVARPLDVAGGLTTPGMLVGTPQYMAPEVLRPEPVTTAYDVFAWGGVVVFAATGRPPFGTGGLMEVLHRITHDPPPRPAGLPPELGNVVEAALAKDPTHRPTAWELLRRLVGPGAEPMTRFVRPVSDSHGFVVVGGERGARYARRLVAHLRRLGLAVRSAYEEPDVVRRLAGAPALIVLVSPGQPDSVRYAVAEAGRLGLETFRILLDGTGTGGAGWYDARDGSMPGVSEIRWLQRTAAAKDAPEPPAQADDRFARLRRLLEEKLLVEADEETTALLLNAAGRAGEGWLKPGDGLDLGFLRDLGRVWASGTDGRHGFGSQLRLHWGHQQPGSTADFRSLTVAFGWAEKLSGRPESYREWVKRHTYPKGFFPTLRNPCDELHSGWYERWRITVMAVHTELRRGL